jgi:lipopolysaccharide export system permease protein
MARLSRYLLGLFWSEAMALFAVAAFLLFLIQCLRLFDALVDRGQNLMTLLGQALLGMPALGTGFLYVCLGIGLGRALRSLQASSELQVIHVEGLLPAMLRATTLFTATGALVLLVLAHIVNPLSQRALDQWSAGIAADLVSRSMIPHKIVQIADSVSITIGARDGAGNITDFFADDHRGASERTYFAKSAIITRDPKGFVLRMQDGAIQQLNAQKRLSQVSFARYDLPMDQLTGASGGGGSGGEDTSVRLIANAMANGWDAGTIDALVRRNAEAIRVVAICLLVFALAGFPSGSRRPARVPIELVVLGAAFVERGLGTFVSLPAFAGPAPGAALLIVAAAVILLLRLRAFVPQPRRLAA